MDSLRSSGLPVPKVYGYSPTSDNVAETEYIFIESADGTKLSDIWFDLEEQEIESVVRQLVQLEAKMMSVCFPAGGSLYYAQDLERVAGKPGIFQDERFCIGPDVRLPLWYGRRSLLDVDQGPCTSLSTSFFRCSSELTDVSRQKRRIRACRNSQEGTGVSAAVRSTAVAIPADQEGKLPVPLVPQDPSLSFPYPSPRPPGDQYRRFEVVRLWLAGHRVRVAFLLVSMPKRLQNYDDSVSQSTTRPSLPENFDNLNEAAQSYVKQLHRRRLVHYHYVKSTEECTEVRHAALPYPMGVLRRRLFQHAGDPWEGETIALKVDLIEATKSWAMLAEGGAPCWLISLWLKYYQQKLLVEEEHVDDAFL